MELRGGRRALLRPLQPTDRERLIETFDRLSPDSRYRRFFRSMETISARDLEYLLNIDHHDHEAILAIDPERNEAIGVARYVRVDPAEVSAEAAVSVVDDWQGRGLGKALLTRLSERAVEEGIQRFTALVQSDNRRALETLRSLGPTTSSHADPLVELDIELTPDGVSTPLAAALQAAAGSLFGTRPLADRILRKAREAYSGRTQPIASRLLSSDPIVVGSDGSPHAAQAVRRAAELAVRLNAPLHVVHAYRDWTERLLRTARLDPARIVPSQLDPRPAAEALVNEIAATVCDLQLDVTPHAREGDPAEALLSVAAEVGAQLLVVGSRGARGPSRFTLGSVPDKLAHAGSCNVLIERARG